MIRKIATDIGRPTSKSSMHNIVKKDLRLMCLKKKLAQELTTANKLTRLVRAKRPSSEKPLVSTKCYDNSLTQVKFVGITVYKIFNKWPQILKKILVETAFCCLVTWLLNHPNSKGYIFVTVASIVIIFADKGQNRPKSMSTKFGSYQATNDQDISKRLGVYFIVDTVYIGAIKLGMNNSKWTQQERGIRTGIEISNMTACIKTLD